MSVVNPGCACGCGQPVSRSTRTRRGVKRGDFQWFATGHSFTRRPERYAVDENGCWNWLGYIRPSGYGGTMRSAITKREVTAHVYYYELQHGVVAVGMDLDHLCRNRRCCNPAHLEPVTRAENARRGAKFKCVPAVVAAVHALAASGLSRWQIAAQLPISRATVGRVLQHADLLTLKGGW